MLGNGLLVVVTLPQFRGIISNGVQQGFGQMSFSNGVDAGIVARLVVFWV